MSAKEAVCAALPVVARPAEEECLGSWIARIATGYAIPTRTLLTHLGVVRAATGNQNWLLLGRLNAAETMTLAKSLRRATSALIAMAPSAWSLSAHSEFGMCVHCVMESFTAGQPLYWRRAWLDAVTIGCLKHAVWLTSVDASLFFQSANWQGIEQILVGIAESNISRVDSRASRNVSERVHLSALSLQSIFHDGPTDRIAQIRYGASSSWDARQIAHDLLDVLLTADTSGSGFSALSEFASLLEMPLAPASVSIGSRPARSMAIRRVKMLGARIFAMAMVDILMFASARINEQYVQPRRYDARSMRMDWLWPLLPQASLELLIQRIKKWPADYVRECWPELENIEKVSMLQRKRKLISQRLSREKPSAERLSLANIRAN